MKEFDKEHILKLEDIDPQYKLNSSNIGLYNPAIFQCPDCMTSYDTFDFKIFKGFGRPEFVKNKWKQVACICECPECFQRYWFHIAASYYNLFLRQIEEGLYKK